MDVTLLAAIAALCTVGGYYFPFTLPRIAKLAILAPLVGAYVFHAYTHLHELPIVVALLMAALGVVVAWRILPYSFCSGHHVGHADKAVHALSALALIPFLLHAILDTELLRETGWLTLPLLAVHKLTDGTALRVTAGALGRSWLRTFFLAIGIFATPLGLLLSGAVIHSVPHELLIMFVVGFYVSLAFALIRMSPQEAVA